MSGASVEYFATTDVLVIMFDSAADSSLDGSQRPSPMSGHVSGAPRVNATDVLNQSALNCSRENSQRSVLMREGRSSQSRRKTASNLQTNRDDREFIVEDRSWPSLL
jgi:hypothetical protein